MTQSSAIGCHGPRLVTMRESGQLGLMEFDVSPESLAKIGARLKRLREHLGFKTQASFANRVGLQRHRYVQYEAGSRLLTIDAAVKIRSKTGCPIDYLYFGDTNVLPSFLRDLAQEPADAAA